MSRMEENEFTSISKVCGSPKRLRLLNVINEHKWTYSDFSEKLEPEINPSELYHHFRILKHFGLIIQTGMVYTITSKGKELLLIIREMRNCLKANTGEIERIIIIRRDSRWKK